ncbi:kWG [Clostridium sp. CAG:356]|nr:kWG [Clostridium sp. CAG:356]
MELYEEVDNKKKSKLPMIIGISLIVLIILIIVIIGTIIYLKQSVMQITVNGQNKNEIEKLLYIPEDDNTKLYIPIRAIAKYLNYNDFRGDYKIKSEDSTKCYVKNENEIAMFTKDSDTLVKTRGDSDYEYVKLEEKVLEKDGELYTTPSGIEKAFNTLFEYNANKKNINIYTMDYLNQMYASKLKIDGETVKLSEEYSDQKAIFEGLIIVIKNNNYGVIDAESGNPILEFKYEDIKYLPATSDFLVKSNNKYGVIGKDTSIKVRTVYDEIKIMDNQNGLYLVKQNNLYGVIDTKGKTIISPEYKQIGIDISKFTQNGIENQYVLLNKIIPVKNNQDLWGMFDIKGQLVKDFIFTGIGCSSSNLSKIANAYPAVVVPSYQVIIVEKDKHYNIITTSGEELIPTYVLETIYLKTNTETGENTFYMAYNNNEKVMSVEEWLASTGR